MIEQPPIRKTDAWAHQARAYAFASKRNGTLLACYMGTGKSKITIDVIQNDPDARNILIVAPPKAVENGVWSGQFAAHCAIPYRIVELHGDRIPKRVERARALAALPGPGLRVFVVNYECAWRPDFLKWALSMSWDYVVADESHRIKTPTAKSSRALFDIGQRSRKRLALTGTPTPNGPLDIFGQARFVSWPVFGRSWTAFKAHYAILGSGPIGRHQIVGYRDQEGFTQQMASFTFAVERDVLTLPEAIHTTIPVELSAIGMRHYRMIEREFITWLDDGTEVNAENVLTRLLRLQEITGGFLADQQIDTSKRDTLAEIVDGIDPNESVVVFARFHNDLDAIRSVAEQAGRAYFEISGRSKDRLEHWRANPHSIIALQMHSGSESIDLTAAQYCVYYSTGYSLTDYQQSESRIHRPGQERTTYYYHLTATGTVDPRVQRALERKRNVQEALLDEIRNGSWTAS